METLKFNALDKNFRSTYKRLRNEGKDVSVIIDGIVDQTKSIYPMLEITTNHVSYYSVDEQGSIIITDKEIAAELHVK